MHAASVEDVDKAVQAAKAALKHNAWKHMSGSDRGILMAKLADLIEEHKDLLATIDAWDNGEHHLRSATCVSNHEIADMFEVNRILPL